MRVGQLHCTLLSEESVATLFKVPDPSETRGFWGDGAGQLGGEGIYSYEST